MKILPLVLFLFMFIASYSNGDVGHPIVISKSTQKTLDKIINEGVRQSPYLPYTELIEYISGTFLGVNYKENTLEGGKFQREALVVNLDDVDDLTFLGYVMALSHATSQTTFLNTLVSTRYKDSKVNYYKRKFFFTDWSASSPQNMLDITTKISPNYIKVEKQLNRKVDGSEYVYGLGTIPRTIAYIPAQYINQRVLDNLKTGDYVGIYSPKVGLDISHAGIVIKKGDHILYRNASPLPDMMKVVDLNFLDYVSSTQGIIVLRPII